MSQFDQFIKEKKLLLNVSPHTVRWYTHALKWLPNEHPSKDDLKYTVLRMRERGLKPTGCNAALRAINSYLSWCESPHRATLLREPKQVMPTFTMAQVKLLVESDYDPKLKSLICVMLDTGARISEALALRPVDIDVANQSLVLHGKGGVDRVVPFSPGYKILCPFPWKRCWVLRLLKAQCARLGFIPPRRTLHSLRHTFAVHWCRTGGNVFALQSMLGHTSLEMSRRYSNMAVADLIAAHRSPLHK